MSRFRAEDKSLLDFVTRWPGWAIVGVAALVIVGALAYTGVSITKRTNVAVVSSVQHCANQPTKLASLFSDGETTMIRLSNPDYTEMRVLRTEPANVLPGMFDALLSLSGDNKQLAYVTASDEQMDDAHIESIDVANPSARTELAILPKGFWVVKPAWSPDNKKLAFVKMDDSGGAHGQFQLWLADTTTQPATVAMQSDLVADNFTNGRSAAICWTADKRVVLTPSSPLTLPAASPTGAAQGAIASPSPSTGSPCGVPMFSQNDPAWRSAVMQTGADSIGEAGCALTSAAMMLNYFGSSLTPSQLSTCLGVGADPINWKAVPSCTNGIVNGGDRIDFTWADLDALLAAGRPAIVGLLRGQTGSHFVVVTTGGGGVADSYRITDPWDATNHKTLASYINWGYNPAWIISYTGPGQNCARLIKGLLPAVPSIDNGKTSKGPEILKLRPGLKYVKFFGLMRLSSGAILKDTFNLPLTFTPVTSDTTINAEGIYQVLVTINAPSNPPRFELYRFTIDNTPPSVDLALLNPRAPSARAASLDRGATASAPMHPMVDKPGKVRIGASDTLSGVREIKYSLDGAPLAQYSSDTTFNRILVVPQSGDHSIRMQAFDAAGNMQDVTKYFTVYGYAPPPPPVAPPPQPPTSNPAPPPPPPPPSTCPTKITGPPPTVTVVSVVGQTATINVSWNLSGGCGPFTGAIVANYGSATGLRPKTYPITTEQGALRDVISACLSGTYPVTYTLTLKDSFNQSITVSQTVNVTWRCIL